jgi:GT2 family glycosyltransferase
LLRGALEALSRLRRVPERVVVVDSASTDPRVAEVAGAADATVVRVDEPGASRARNAGAVFAAEDVVAFTDDDCLVDPGWTEAIVEAFSRPSPPDFVTGQVRADAAPRRRGAIDVSVLVDPTPRTFRAGDDPRTFGHSANMAWRRAALLDVGGFDELLGAGAPLRAAEDVDLGWRAVRSGLRGDYLPGAVVTHRRWRTRRESLRIYHAYGVGSGALAVKRSRLDGVPPRTLVRSLLVDEGLAPVVRSLAKGHEMSALADAAMFLGRARGAYRARRLALDNDRFAPP